jgi:hypothetical protein
MDTLEDLLEALSAMREELKDENDKADATERNRNYQEFMNIMRHDEDLS